MPMLRPFTGHVPTSSFGARVVGPPKALLPPGDIDAGVDDPLSFRYSVGRGAGPSSDEAQAWIADMVAQQALAPVEGAVIVHSAERAGRATMGVLADVSIAAYERDQIKRHEKTIASNEQKMVGYMLLTRVFGNPVVLAHRPDPVFSAKLVDHASRPPDIEFEARDGTHHRMWIVTGEDASTLAELVTEDLYIADGHHRLEAACALANAEGRDDAWFPAGLYAENEFDVWAFARGVRDSPLSKKKLIARLEADFDLAEVDAEIPRPPAPHTFGVRIGRRSFILTIPDDHFVGDAHDRLDVSVLQNLILEPMLGIDDPRRDPRLDLVADAGDDAHDPSLYDAWFLPYPTPAGDVMDVADLGRTMPPKSTYFLPKLPGGIVVRPV